MDVEQIKEYYTKYKFQVHLAILSVLFLINCFWGGFAFVSFAFAIFLITTYTIKGGFSVLVFCIPFIAIANPFSYLLYFIAVVTFVTKSYIQMYVIEKRKPSKFLTIVMAIFILYLLIPFAPYNLNFFIKFVCFILLFLIINLFLKYPKSIRLKYNICLLAFSFVISSVFLLTLPLSSHLQHTLSLHFVAGENLRFTALLPNPNPLAMICQICLSILIVYIVSKNFNLFDIWSFIIFTTIGVLTMSKTFIIILAFLLLILFLFALYNSPKHALIGCFFILVPLIFLFVFKNSFIMHYFDRFVSGIIKGLNLERILNIVTTNRYLLWTDYVNYIIANPLVLIFGRGLGAPRISYESPHNFFISLIYNLGLVGFTLLILITIAIIRVARKNTLHKPNWLVLIPLFVIFLITLVEDFFLFIRL